MDVLEPFLLDFTDLSDLNASDIEKEIIRLNEQRKITTEFLKGEIPLEILLDCVADFELDAYEYLGIVEDNINSFIENQIIIENPELILL